MINFRFHLVSLIAVFLALGLGILVGSTVVDQVVVDRLDREIRSVRHDSSAVNSANDTLKGQISQLDDYLAKSSSYIVDGRLTADPVAVVAAKGVSTGTVKATVDMLREAGAEVPGVLWLDEKWSLGDAKDLQTLADATSASGNAIQVRTAAVRQFVQRLATLPKAGKQKPPPDVIAKLRSKGFLTFSDGSNASLADFPASSPRVLVLTGTDSRLSSTPTVANLVSALAAAKIPTVVAEAYDAKGGSGSGPAPQRADSLQAVQDNAGLAKTVSTVDDVEMLQGQVATTLALEEVADGQVGHYGYGSGADAPLPDHP